MSLENLEQYTFVEEVESQEGQDKAMQKRKRRSDAGSVKLTQRDLFLLDWISHMYAIRLDHLQILAGRYSPSQKNNATPLSDAVCRRLVGRWEKAGLVERKYILYKQPQWVWLTKDGLDLIGSELPYRKPAVGRLRHIYSVNGVRLFIEKRMLKGKYMPYKPIPWTSDRVVNIERQERGKRHIVDGELLVKGEVVAIEVELTAKSQKRLKSILEELREDYSAVWYFATDDARQAVEKAVDGVGGKGGTFKFYPIPDLAIYTWEN